MNRLLLLAAIVPAAALGAPPRHVIVHYELSYNGFVMADEQQTLEHDGKSYRIVSEGRGRGLFALRGTVTRSSAGAIAPEGLRPTEFRDQRGDRVATARLDWTNRTLTQERQGAKETEPLPENASDRLSFQWTFAFAPPKTAAVEAMVVDGRGAPVRYLYSVAGKETLKTALGDLETLHLVKQKEGDDKRGTEVWLDVKRDYIPVRVLVIDKDGARIDQVVTRIEG
jgi:uncharacterized protein DUF3108